MQSQIDITRHSPVNYRHELKYLANDAEARMVATRMATLLERDCHAGRSGTYIVTSMYFDTPYDTALRQKIEGFSKREKFRIRYYGSQPSSCRLEKKIKANGLCAKRSARLSPCEVERIIKGDGAFLLDGADPLHLEFCSKLRGQLLRPCVVVRYEREAFSWALGNTRVTIDRNVRTTSGVMRFLEVPFDGFDALQGLSVVEVKFDAFLPSVVRDTVAALGRSAQACSKYVLGRRYG